MKTIVKNFFTLLISLVLVNLFCADRSIKRDPDSLRFALTGNTSPETPFKVPSERIKDVFLDINKSNPVFLVHLGDIIFGGEQWMGINTKDICKQYNKFYRYASSLKPILYTVRGNKDNFNKRGDLYCKFTKRDRYYSFNYGNIHFVVLDTVDKKQKTIGAAQLKWLEKDLTHYKNSPSIFIFTYYPVYVPLNSYSSKYTDFLENADTLHKLLSNYPVKAVFSGYYSSYHELSKDKILYIIAGCAGYNESDRYKKYNNYYIVDYITGNIKISPQKVTYEKSPPQRYYPY